MGHIRPGQSEVDEVWTSDATVSGFQPREAHGLADGSHLALVESYTRFPTLVHIRDGLEREVATFSHPGVTTMSSWSGVMERVDWRGRDGLDLQGFLVRPAGPGPHPLVVQIHGGPVAAWHNTWGFTMGERYPITNFLVAEGYAVLLPNPRGSTGRGIEFAARVLGDMNGEDAHDIMAGVHHLVDRGVADARRVGVTGNSYGGLMSAWLITQNPALAAAIVRSPVTDFRSQHLTSNIPAFDRIFLRADPFDHGGQYDQRSPISHAAAIRTPTLLIAGALDRCTPPSQAEELFGALRALDVPSELVIYPREGHGVVGFPETVDHLARILGWFSDYLGNRSDTEP